MLRHANLRHNTDLIKEICYIALKRAALGAGYKLRKPFSDLRANTVVVNLSESCLI